MMAIDRRYCLRCGHESAYHGQSFCAYNYKRLCDCIGWSDARLPEPVTSPGITWPHIPVNTSTVSCICPPNRGGGTAGTCPVHDVQVTYSALG